MTIQRPEVSPAALVSWLAYRAPAQYFSADIGPEFRSQIADQVETEPHTALEESEPRGVEAIRVPDVRKKSRAIGATDAPGGECLATRIGAREDSPAERMP